MCSRLRRSSNSSCPMLARGVTSTSRIASADKTETIARPSRCSRTAVSSSPRRVAAPSSSAGAMIAGMRAAMSSASSPGRELAVDQQAIVPEDDGGVHPVPLPNGGDQITNARHASSPAPRKVVAKLEINIVEVKRHQSLEVCARAVHILRP